MENLRAPLPPGEDRSGAGLVRAWLVGIRPGTLYAALGPVAAGGGLAASDGRFRLLPFAAALAGALLLQIGTNLANDYSDFVRGADAPDRLGAARVTQSGLLSPQAVRAGAAVAFGLAFLIGLYLVATAGWPIAVLGIAAIAAGLLYTGGPWPYGYHGLGDLFTFLFFGPVAVAGTYYVQAGTLSPGALVAGTGIGALVTAILVVNNLRDRTTDARAGKRTLAVRLGERGTKAEYLFLLGLGALVPPIGVARFGWPASTLLSWGALLAARGAVRTILHATDPLALNPVLGRTARIAALYGLLLAAGLILPAIR